MSIETYYHRPAMQTRLREGPLGCYIDLFAEQLQREGHCQQGRWRNICATVPPADSLYRILEDKRRKSL